VSKPFVEGKPKAITRCPPDEIRFKWTDHTAQCGGIEFFPGWDELIKISIDHLNDGKR
jgi:hypothetical protein